jgi:exopolysaccharide biosynthesis polyprenyl glycosylphosphotransferase
MHRYSNILGVRVDRFTTDEVLKKIEEFASQKTPHQIVYLNADGINRCMFDKRYKKIVNEADLVYPDGMGIVWASRFSRHPLPERVNAGDFLPDLCRLCIQKGYKIFLLGSKDGIAEKAARNLKREFRDLQIAGAHHGFFKDEEEDKIIEKINSSGADILLVGMGSPRQEKWIKRNMHRLNSSVLWGVGALFDYYAYRVKRSPVFLRKIGLEWLFRLALEPKRLWKRYILGNAFFLLRLFAILLIDAGLISLSWIGTWWLRYKLNFISMEPINPIGPYINGLPILVTAWILTCVYFGIYRRELSFSGVKELSLISKAVLMGMLIAMALAFLFKEFSFGRSIIIASGIINFVFLTLSHYLFYRIDTYLIRRGFELKKVIIIGKGELAKKVKDEIEDKPSGYEVIGFIDDSGDGQNPHKLNMIGGIDELDEIIEDNGAGEIFIASERPLTEELNIVVRQRLPGVQFKLISSSLVEFSSRISTEKIKDVPLVDLSESEQKRVYEALKRSFDLMFSAIGIILCLPLFLIVALLIKLEAVGPAIFVQRRAGKGGKPFLMYKFRTMYKNVKRYETAPNDLNDARVTKVGRVLRRLSIDELPQLFNVFLGQMSFVGPRPEMLFVVKRYEPWQAVRLSVRPGITGLWQVTGRKELPLEKNLEYDFYYIKHRSMFLDLAILLKTIPAVLSRRGAY